MERAGLTGNRAEESSSINREQRAQRPVTDPKDGTVGDKVVTCSISEMFVKIQF